MPQTETNLIPLDELGLTGDAFRSWAAAALFSSDMTTAQIKDEPRMLIRPLVRAIVRSISEEARQGRVASEFGEYPAEASARMAACAAAVADAPSWPLLADWQVAK
ncbi:hypothetical protein ACIGZJ_36140 [Kitasatospora sp. NPDC052868]|uniref:hypothetical protein n=1 Tax=Kitasatospora sp. NPDC052868 TaxID=3364060 RepID=UPI0037CC631B